METKRVTENFYERNTPDCDPDTIKVTLDSIETLFEECDKKLTEAELSPSNYESQELQIGVMRNNLLTLQLYVADAHNEVYNELDKTLCDDFQNGATHTLSNIVLSEIETENTFMMEEHLQFNEMSGTYYLKEVKKSVTMADFLGLAAVEPGEGAPTLENMETVGIFATLFRMDYQSFQESGVDVDQIMEVYLYSGEYAHKKNEPVKEFVSGLLDITIVKPFIECIVGKDLITGEKLTDFEMAMKFVDVAIGVLTFGQGTLAIDAAGLVGKEAFSAMMKTWAIDVAADAAAYTAGYVCDELGLPQEAVVLASLITGCTVSVTASKKYLFVDSAGNEVMECTPEELEALLKNGGSGNIEGGADTVAYHSVGGENSAKKIQSVLDGIDISYTSPESRFGQGFYVAADGNTTLAELAYHGTDAKYSIRYDMNLEGQKVLDLTDPKIASEWGFLKGESSLLECQNIAEIALDEGYNVIKVHSYRDAGINYVIYDNFDEILQPQMVTPIGD